MLDGDGLALRFGFNKDGSVHFISKFVRTKEFQGGSERKIEYRGTFEPARAAIRTILAIFERKTSRIRTYYIGTVIFALCKLDVRLKSMKNFGY